MKVLFLTNIPAPYSVDFYNELGNLCDLTVLYERYKARDRDIKWEVNSKTRRNYREIFLNGLNITRDGALCISVINYLKDKQYDVIIIGGYYTPTGMLAIQYLNSIRRPFVLNTDGGVYKKDKFLKRLLKKHFIGSASAWFSSGTITNKYLIGYGAKSDHIFWYPFTSVRKDDLLLEAVKDFEKDIIKERLNIKEKKVVISVGQFIHRKGHDILLKSFHNMDKDIGLYIIGGDATEEYKELKQSLNLESVHFIEFKTKEELKDYYKIADLFVFATREDIWGLVINEAIAHGVPVVSSMNCVAAIEILIEGKNGFLIQSENINDFHEKMKMILNNDKMLLEMSSENLELAKIYTIENMAVHYYQSLLKILEDKE